MPVCAGLTVAAPSTTKSLIPSFGYGGDSSAPKQAGGVRLVVAEERARASRSPRGSGSPSSGCSATSRSSRSVIDGFGAPMSHDQVLRNHSVGRTSIDAGSGPGVPDAEAEQEVVGRRLGVVGGDLPVAPVVEDPGVEQLELRLELRAPRGSRRAAARTGTRPAGTCSASACQECVGRRVEEPPVLLRVLAVIAVGAAEAEDPLLQDRVAAVPEGEGEAEDLPVVADAREAVLVPAVGARTGVVVREVAPRVAVGAVVLAHGSPAALAQVRPPAPPGRAAVRHLEKTRPLGAGCLASPRRRLSTGSGRKRRIADCSFV